MSSSSTTSQMSFRDYFKLHRFILKICGISFAPNISFFYKLYSFFILSITFILYPILASFELFKHDFDTSSGIFLYQMGTIAAGLKAIFLLVNRAEIDKLLTKLEQKPFLPNTSRGGQAEENIVEECIRKSNLQTNVYWIFTATSISTYSLYALSTRMRSNDYHKWQLPCNPLTILDITYSPNYEITWLYQFIVLSVTTGVYVITDLIVAGILAHISYQFKVLQNFLRRIVEFSRKDMLKDLEHQTNRIPDWKYLKTNLKVAIEYHLAILGLSKEMEKHFRNLLLAAFLGVMGILCFQIYMIAVSEHFNRATLRHISEYTNATLPIFMICYWGEELLFQSEGVANAAFESDFVGADKRFQSALVMIIRRSQTPVKLTAGRYADVCMDTCFGVLRKSYSFCMVLRHMNRK